MRATILILTFIALLAPVETAKAESSARFTDDRFGYSIEYPGFQLFVAPGKSGSLETDFISDDRAIRLQVFGYIMNRGNSIEGSYAKAQKDYSGAEIVFQRLRSNFFVITGTRVHGLSFYHAEFAYRVKKGFELEGKDAIAGFTLSWPADRKAEVERKIQSMFDSFYRSVN